MEDDHGGEIVIVGAGLAGALLACLLGRAGHDVAVYERRPDPRTSGFAGGRSINLALSARGIHALERAGLAAQVLEDAIAMPGRMIHAPSGELTFQPYSKNPSDAINSVSRGGLNVRLLDGAASFSNVRLFFEHRCVDLDPDRPAVILEDAEGRTRTVEAGLVVGADGAFSAVRARLQRMDRFDYSQSFLEHGYKELSIPPADHGRFSLDPGALHIWPRGGFMMIGLPNVDCSFTCTIFWPYRGPRSFESVRTEDDVLRFFAASFPDALPLMPTLVEDFFGNPTGSMVTIRCAPWHHEEKVVLVGDAAHAIVPFYGQGINAGFEDCVELADQLARFPGDRQEALERYERRRKPHTEAIADLALENFVEMRDRVGSRLFRLGKRTERTLHQLLPFWYTPLYNMVSFSLVPYAEARARARRQRLIIRIAVVVMLVGLAGLVAWIWPSPEGGSR